MTEAIDDLEGWSATILAATTPEAENPLRVFVDLMLSIWPLWVVIGAVGALRLSRAIWVYYRGVRAQRRSARAREAEAARAAHAREVEIARIARSGIADIDTMDGRTFEQYLVTLFERLGYHVELTQYRGDYGADLVIEKDDRRTAVQAKRYSKPVGLKAVQEVVASKGTYRCDAAMVVANRGYTPQAKRLAADNDVELWDRERLVEMLLAGKDAPAQPAPPVETAKTEPPPADASRCATCGATVSEKVRRYCLDHPERFDGLVYCFADQRSARLSKP